MLNFKPLRPEDADWLRPIAENTDDLCSACCFSSMVLWGGASIASCGDFIVPLADYGDGPVYLRPLGKGDFTSILPALFADNRERGVPFRLYGVTDAVRTRMEQAGKFSFSTDRANSDYLYPVEALVELAGKKLHGKRNHIHRFEQNFPDWSCEPVSPENLPDCQAMTEIWYQEHYALGVDPAEFARERRALDIAFSRYETFGFDGLLLRAEGKVVAYSFGLPLNRTTYDVNFEKAFSSVQGAYAVINREFARLVRKKYPETAWLDREDDMGSEGLRKAKLSYHPSVILDKYTAFLPEDGPCAS
jgi:hypothetical protein